MSALDARAQHAYDILRMEKEVKFTWPELISLDPAVFGMGGQRSRTIVNKVRELAANDGLYFRHACPANGFTYMLTSNAAEAIDSEVQLRLIQYGVEETADNVADLMIDDLEREGLDAFDLAILKHVTEMDRQLSAGQRQVWQAIAAKRRSGRSNGKVNGSV